IERWYYRMGGEGIYFEYQEEYLLTPKEASEQLGVSNVTVNKYMKQGLEMVDTNSHRKIPIHAVELWKDPVYAIRMQMLAQEKEIKNQPPEERLKEVREEIIELQKKYKAKTSHEAMRNQGIIDIDMRDDPSDFRNWEDLENEQEDIVERLIEGKEISEKKSGKQDLQPTDLDIILESYEDILQSYQNHKDKNSIYGTFKKTNRKLEVLFSLKEH